MDIPKEALLKEGFQEADVNAGLKIFAPKGCQNCSDGYKGRVGIYQVLPITESRFAWFCVSRAVGLPLL